MPVTSPIAKSLAQPHPVVVIGAGPIGLAAAAHLVEESIPFVLLEAGKGVAANVSDWAHVRLFSPWRYSIDAAAARLLSQEDWLVPDLDGLPTGAELQSDYLEPLARTGALAKNILFNSRVTAVTKGVDRVDHRRDATPFVVRYVADGEEFELKARSVIDATGTWSTPNPIGANGVPARGELAHNDRLIYGIPDILGSAREQFSGRSVAVVGSGHSAANALLALVELQHGVPSTSIHWVVRGREIRAFGGGDLDELAARGRLGTDTRRAIDAGHIRVHHNFRVSEVASHRGRMSVRSESDRIDDLDRVIVATGQRPDHSLASELRLDLDPALESTRALAPLIDPNVHSCGTVRMHSFRHLEHLDRGYFTAGAKSYGRAPTFLLATGYEQVRSIAAHLAGDDDRASKGNLVLPATGVCGTDSGSGSCCSSEEPADVHDLQLTASRSSSCC